MLTDFRNSFNVGFCNKCATRFLYFPPHLKHVTTLPCETSAAGFQQVTNDVRGRDEVRENELEIFVAVVVNMSDFCYFLIFYIS